MPEYIERSALLRTLSKEVEYSDDGDQEINSDTVFIAIESAPAADVAEVVHGRWIEDPCGWHCSECGADGRDGWKFCPNCGAKMDGEV